MPEDNKNVSFTREKKKTCPKNLRIGYFRYLGKRVGKKRNVAFSLKNKIQGYPVSDSCAKAAVLETLAKSFISLNLLI